MCFWQECYLFCKTIPEILCTLNGRGTNVLKVSQHGVRPPRHARWVANYECLKLMLLLLLLLALLMLLLPACHSPSLPHCPTPFL